MSLTNHTCISKTVIKKHLKVLNHHLRDYFRLLDSTPKPSNEKVRAEFIRHEAEWLAYCAEHKLGGRMPELFNANISLEWEKKYTQ